MKLDALKRQGARSDLTSSQVGMKLQALDIVGQEAGDSRNQVHRFIRLTNLIPELLDMVDEKKISFNPAVELSYLDESQQRDFLEAMADTQNAPSLSQAQRLKKLAQEGHFSYDVAFAVMGEPKKDELDKVVIKNDTLRKYFPESSTPREMEEKIIGLLEESKTEKVVFRSDSIKKYFPSNYSSEQIENSILKMTPKAKWQKPIIPSQRGCWPMPKNGLNVSLNSYDDIFSTEEARQEEQREQVQQISIEELHPFKDHPFKVLDDEAMQHTVESIKLLGVTNPLIARPRPEGGYEIISGHRRQHAAQLAGLKALPVIVRQMDDDAAVLLMVDSNLQREQILPSERAFAYKMKLDALKRQGARSDLTSTQVAQKLSVEKVGEDAGVSKDTIRRFIRLTNLIPELLDMVDEKKISFNPAVELSYLDENQQRDFLEAMSDTQNSPSLSQAQRLKKLAQKGHFSYDVAFAVMGEPKKDELDKVVIKNDTLRKYFPESSTPREMEEKIIGLLEESKAEKIVFRSDALKKYFPSSYSSKQIEDSIIKLLDQRLKKRKHEAER